MRLQKIDDFLGAKFLLNDAKGDQYTSKNFNSVPVSKEGYCNPTFVLP